MNSFAEGSLRIALVHDRLNVRGGAEVFLEEVCRLYPHAQLFTLIYEPAHFAGSPIAQRKIHTSYLDRLPLARRSHRIYIPLMPWAVERLDLSEFDLVISSSAAFAHGVKTHPRQLHLSYVHSPMRYAWHQRELHTRQLGYGAWPVRVLLAGLRKWDRRSSQRAQALMTNSRWTQSCIQAAFGRSATVIYPPVHVERFQPAAPRREYYLTVSRLVPYKRVDLIVRAFSQLGLPLVVAGDGPQAASLRKLAGANVTFLNEQSDEQIAALMNAAKAFVYAAEEDFGIAAVEAQAAGCPVVAYGRGGLLETVAAGQTGLFFAEQSVPALVNAVQLFEAGGIEWKRETLRANAARFSAEVFRENFTAFVENAWREFTQAANSHTSSRM